MTRSDLLEFLRARRLCVQASVDSAGGPQAAVVGYGVSDDLELVFDTSSKTRKMVNLRRDPRISVVVGWDDEQTLQIDGVANEPVGDELARLKNVYFDAHRDGVERQTWAGITYVRVRAHWARFSDFRPGGSVLEFDEEALRGAPSKLDGTANDGEPV